MFNIAFQAIAIFSILLLYFEFNLRRMFHYDVGIRRLYFPLETKASDPKIDALTYHAFSMNLAEWRFLYMMCAITFYDFLRSTLFSFQRH